jgi:hypothetical protein
LPCPASRAARWSRRTGTKASPTGTAASRKPKHQRQQHGRTALVFGERLRRGQPGSRHLRTPVKLESRSLKTGVGDARGLRPLCVPASGRGPWAPRDRRRRTASAPGGDRVPRVLTTCSRDVALLHATGRDDCRCGVTHALLSPLRLERKEHAPERSSNDSEPNGAEVEPLLDVRRVWPVGQRASATISRSWACWDRLARSAGSTWRRSERLARWPMYGGRGRRGG